MPNSLYNQYLSLSVPTDGYVEYNEIGMKLDGSQSFCIESWVYLNGMGIDISILKKEGVFAFGISHGLLYWKMSDGTMLYSNGFTKVTSGKWQYVSISYDKTNLCFYINSSKEGAIMADLSTNDNSKPYVIAANLDGRMRTLRIFSEDLSPVSIIEDMFNPARQTGLVADFDFTCNPPKDNKHPDKALTLKGRSRIKQYVPALYLSGTAYSRPCQCDALNPGGRQIDPYTVQASIYITGSTPRQSIFVNGNHDIDSGMALYLRQEEGGYKLCALRGNDSNAENKLYSKSIIKTDTWTHIAITYDGQTSIMYIDGKEDARDAQSGPILIPQSDGNVLIGGMLECGRPTGTNTFQGYISRVDVWNTSLSKESIQKYCNEAPDESEENLVDSFDFTNEPFSGVKENMPVALLDGAGFKELVSETQIGLREIQPIRAEIKANPYAIRREREKLDITSLLAAQGPEATGDTLLFVNHYIENQDYVIVAHYKNGSYAVGRYPIDKIDDCILLKIELLFTLIAGAISVLFGLKATLSTKAIDYIQRNIISLAAITALLATGEKMKASDVFSFVRILKDNGLLKDLLKLVVTLGFWAMLRFIAKVLLTFTGLGMVDTIASLAATAITFVGVFAVFVTKCLRPSIVALRELKFNHNILNYTNSALNIRHNKLTTISVPEWVNGQSEPVAYALAQTNNVVIKARFVIYTPLVFDIDIRAIAIPGNPMGDLPRVQVHFALFTSGEVSFNVNNAVWAGITIGKQNISWRWEFYNTNTHTWQTIGQTAHDVYFLADLPRAPWSQALNLSALWPWTDFLDKTAGWLPVGGVPAQGANLATTFTDGIHNSGMQYRGGRVYFSNNEYNLSDFLTDSAVAFNNVQIECSDISLLLMFVTHIWGGNNLLVYSFLDSASRMKTSNLLPIGLPTWRKCTWEYHVAAFSGAALTNTSLVYDCCLRLDNSNNPWGNVPGGAPILPGGTASPMVSGAYNVNLAAPYAVLTDYFDRLFEIKPAFNRVRLNASQIIINNIK